MTELSNTEADDQEEEVPEATPEEDAPQETQSKNKRKRKAQSKKQPEGESFSLLFIRLHLFSTFHLLYYIIFKILIIKLSVSIEAVDESSDYVLRDEVFTACKVGDVDAICRLLQLPGETSERLEQSESNPSEVPSHLTVLNKPIDSSGFTFLHVASAAAQKAVVRLLLDAGADPACRYKK